ncbi:DoxX-like family protein [Pseudoxanthomonas sp. GM95]|uniref:DoxX family protein n=1 Tax=Pseudoxanthomonas sp. GM95 TaxID=1881043 RepID=UPI0008C37909|nr:DoxX family protein [Pseudoxanthomonas sp. GM95]SEL11436.1 DoxX-like family protein [Pseudoxanthomonas sp. GM95]
MRRPSLPGFLSLLLAAFLFFGAINNTFPSATTVADYVRWGYPSWFHFVTAALEFSAAACLIAAETRMAGALIATFVMTAAAGTLIFHGSGLGAAPAIVALGLALAIAYTSTPRRHPTPTTELL